MAITDAIKRAPRWAWYSAAGVGLGAAAIKLWNDRDATPDAEKDAVASEDYSDPYGYNYGVGSASPAGVIVPPVIIGGNNSDPQAGVPQLQELYIGAVSNLISGWENVWGPVQEAQLGLLLGNAETISNIAQAGASPAQQPASVVVVSSPPTPQPAPAPVATTPAPTPTPTYRTECLWRNRDNGKSGAERRVWCVKVKVHRYSDGRAVVVDEQFVASQPCWAPEQAAPCW